MTQTRCAVALALSVVLLPPVCADQGSFTNSGGSTATTNGIGITSNVAAPAGSLSLNCPASSVTTCAAGSFSYASTGGSTSLSATFTSGQFAEACSGGGKDGHTTCGYTFTGYFSGTLTANGLTQSIIGVTYQGFAVGAAASGVTAYNSTYSPFYYSDSEQIHRSDDLQGTNQVSYSGQSSPGGSFYGANGIALDSAGRIYVADTYNCRVVRIDDMNGTNWTSYGTCGSGQGQFADPGGIAVDSAGKIYVLDSGNCRIVRIDDLTGANWVAYGTLGSGVGQFAGNLASVAVDAGSHIYIADTSNLRIVRMDDMNGSNWTVLAQSPVINGASYSLQAPIGVALDSSGRIYIADAESYQPAVIRVDDMTGANWITAYIGAANGVNSIAVDSSGAVFLGASGVKIVDGMAGVLGSSGTIGPIGSYYVFGVTPLPLPSPLPATVSLSPNNLNFSQDPGVTASQTVTVSNFGGSPLNFNGISASAGLTETNTCGSQLMAGSNCTVTVTYTPPIVESVTGQLSIKDDSGNLGSVQQVPLSGVGLARYPLTVTINPAAGGSVTPVSGTTFDQGSTVTVTAVPAARYRFIAWTGDLNGNTNPATLTMDSPMSVTANFAVPADSCSLNSDGKPTAANARTLINQSTGGNLPAYDMNGDGSVNVVDIQIVINAVIGLGCAMTQQ